ncbi:hypothetical protein Tco_0420462 [Tanacetum coccineum]
MYDDLQYFQSLEKELDKLQFDKNEFSNEYDLLFQECLINNIMCVALSSIADIDEYSEMACKYLEKIKECKCLEIKLSKQTNTIYADAESTITSRDIAISELKKLIEKQTRKSVKTKFDKPPVVRQTNAIKVPKPSVLGKPTPFSDSLDAKRILFKNKSVVINVLDAVNIIMGAEDELKPATGVV